MTVSAQFNTGSVYFTGLTGANFGYERISTEFAADNRISYDIHLEGGYFIRNRLAIGAAIFTGIDGHSNYFLFGPSPGQHDFFLGPNVRYYIARDDDFQIYYFGNPYFGFGNSPGSTLGVTAGAGVNYFLTERLALEARASYNYHRWIYEFAPENTHRIIFEIGISLFFPSITFFDQS